MKLIIANYDRKTTEERRHQEWPIVMQDLFWESMNAEKLSLGSILIFFHLKNNMNVVPKVLFL